MKKKFDKDIKPIYYSTNKQGVDKLVRTLEKYSEILDHTSEIGGTVSLTIKGKRGEATFKSRRVKTDGRHVLITNGHKHNGRDRYLSFDSGTKVISIEMCYPNSTLPMCTFE